MTAAEPRPRHNPKEAWKGIGPYLHPQEPGPDRGRAGPGPLFPGRGHHRPGRGKRPTPRRAAHRRGAGHPQPHRQPVAPRGPRMRLLCVPILRGRKVLGSIAPGVPTTIRNCSAGTWTPWRSSPCWPRPWSSISWKRGLHRLGAAARRAHGPSQAEVPSGLPGISPRGPAI